jgi:hypothetical protein
VVDVFEEVDEQIRSDHYRTLALRYLPWIGAALGVALVAALVIWGYTRYQAANAAKASEAYAEGLDALSHTSLEQAFSAFGLAAKSPSSAYRSLALMQQAGVRIDQQRANDAVTLFDEAAKAAPNLVLGDAARLKAAMTLLDQGQYAQAETRLQILTSSKRPYGPLAREALAVEKLETGHAKEARSDFVVLSLMADAPDDVRQRAQVAKSLIDAGGPGNLAAIVTAARALPPPPPSADAGPAAAAPDSNAPQAGAAQ